MTSHVIVPSAGVLSGDGAAIVHALVYHHPTPNTPPDSLAELVDPIRGSDGGVHDWRLSPEKLLAHRDDHVNDMWSRFTAWRRTYVVERALGDLALVRSFLKWAEQVTDVGACLPLTMPRAQIEPKVTGRLLWVVHQAEVACNAASETGVGITAPDRKGLVRGFVVGDQRQLLLADDGAEVYAVRSGLEINDPKPLLVHGWVVEADGVTVISDEGPVTLGTARGGRLLAQVAPGVAQASVGSVPLTDVFAPLWEALCELAKRAKSDRVPLWIHRGY
jgi:hypothetical protein